MYSSKIKEALMMFCTALLLLRDKYSTLSSSGNKANAWVTISRDFTLISWSLVIITSAYIIGGVIGGIKVFAYFLAAFLALAAASGFLGGRPTGLKAFSLSRVSGGYTFSDNMGSIPATWSRCLTVTGVISRASDSSVMVYPSVFITTLSNKIKKIFTLRDNNTKQILPKKHEKTIKISQNVRITFDLFLTLCDNYI
jgi:hypothetical protein